MEIFENRQAASWPSQPHIVLFRNSRLGQPNHTWNVWPEKIMGSFENRFQTNVPPPTFHVKNADELYSTNV